MRSTKTASGATAVQIIRYLRRKKVIVKHIGSAHTPEEFLSLREVACSWIERETRNQGQRLLFPSVTPPPPHTQPPMLLNNCIYVGVRYTFLYEVLSRLLRLLQFHTLKNQLLFDLVLMRIIQPASKLASLAYVSDMFGISYQRGHLYEAIATFSAYKDTVEKQVVEFARDHYSFDFSMVFYDVTTLYYESFTEDEDTLDDDGNVTKKGLRKDGFSKDLKCNQPQIVIGLMVNGEGFPVAYEIFEGNTFEGDTFIPAIHAFKRKHHVKKLIIVADAAMISFDNVQKIQARRLKYIVGARIAHIPPAILKKISRELNSIDGATGRIRTDKGTLVYDFSQKRYTKDKREMEKQIQKAQLLVENNSEGKRTKFLTLKQPKQRKKKGERTDTMYELNTTLIEKTTRLLGVKGYYTNLTKNQADNKTIIDHYHRLWRVEKAFRIAKSDLAMRPIYHFKRETIEAHILLCFMALAVCAYMERETKTSTKKSITLLKKHYGCTTQKQTHGRNNCYAPRDTSRCAGIMQSSIPSQSSWG